MTTAHEPRRGPGIHLSVEDLSALAEGAQPSAEGASEHLLDCAECRAEVDSIAQLLAAFETLEPPGLPQEVAIRIDAALAREASARAASPKADSAAEPAGAVSARSRRSRWRLPQRIGVGLASLAALAGGLALAVNLVSSSSSSGGSEASNGAAAARNPGAASAKGAPMRPEDALGSPTTLAPTTPLAVWVRQALAVAKPEMQTNSPCLADPQLGGDRPLRVVNGTYEGAAATLVVYANGSDTTTVRAIVYAQPCTAPNYRVLAQGIVVK